MAITREQETDLIVAIRNGDKDPFTVDKGDITARVAYQMVQAQPSSVQMIPREHLDADVVKEAILRGGENAMQYLPDHIVSPGIEYDEMSDIQRAAADGIEERQDYEKLLERAINEDPRAISGIPTEYQKSLIEPVDLIQIAQNNSDTAWIGFVDEGIFNKFDKDGDLRFTDTAYQVMAGNPNLIGEMFDSGILSEDRQGDIKAAQQVLIEATNPEGSSTVRRSFEGDIDGVPAAVWTNEAAVNYARNYADAANVVMRYEEYTGNNLSSEEKAEVAANDPEALGSDGFKEIRELAASDLIADEDNLPQVKRFALEVDMGERSANVRPKADGEDAMLPYAEAFLQDSDNLDLAHGYILDAGKKLDAEKQEVEQPGRLDDFVAKMEDQDKQIQLVANGNEEAFQVHEQLKSGELQLGDMSAEQKTLLNDINWQTTVSETFEGHPFEDAQRQAMPGDSDWMRSMERSATVEMESPGGLKLEFGIQTEPSTTYDSVETLREFYDCQVGVDPEAPAMVNDKPVSTSDLYELSDELRDHWEDPALQEVGQLPVEYEAIADRTFSDLAIDETMEVIRNDDGDLIVDFTISDPDTAYHAGFSMKEGDPESLSCSQPLVSQYCMEMAKTYVAENEQMLAAEVAEFKLQEVGLSKIEVDYEIIEGAGQVYFATFDNNGENGYVGLDSETLKIDSQSEGYSQLSEAQVEVLSAELAKHTEGMTPPMGVEMAERKAEELGELTDKKVHIMDYSADSNSEETGYSIHEVSDVGDDSVRVTLIGSYESATEMNRDLDSKILEARESLSVEREEPKQEVERQRHEEEPERRGMRI